MTKKTTVASGITVIALFAGISAALAWEMPRLESDVFAQKPVAADASGKPACVPAKKYVDLTNAGKYDQIATVFAEDAVFRPPTGETLRGRKEIAAFYNKFLNRIKPSLVPISFIAEGNECLMELAAKTTETGRPDEYILGAIDHFTTGPDGLATQMVVYVRPKVTPVAPTAGAN